MGRYASRLHRKLASRADSLPTEEPQRRPGELLPGGIKDIPMLIQEGLDPIHAVYAFIHNMATRFAEAVVEFTQDTRPQRAAGKALDEKTIQDMLKRPFPEKMHTALDAALDLMHWTDDLLKVGYPSARQGTPAAFDPMSTVAIHLTDEELQLILNETYVVRTKTLRPQLEEMGRTQRDITLSVHAWGLITSSLCAAGEGAKARKRAMTLAGRIARSLAEAVGFEKPPLEK